MTDMEKNAMSERIEHIYTAIRSKNSSAQLLTVSKFHSTEEIQAAIECGLSVFGENRPQELCEKFPSLIAQNKLCNKKVSVHMIGNLQRNKVKSLVPVVSCIQSVDRIELLYEIEKYAEKKIDVLFEYHTGEESKSGFTSKETLYEVLTACEKLPHINPKGFMTMAPFTKDIQAIRKSFQMLYRIAQEAQTEFSQYTLSELSMGMSNDYEIALEEGSTMVRIGTAIFGSRI